MNEEHFKHLVLDFQPRQLLFHAQEGSGINSDKMRSLLKWANAVAAEWSNKLPDDRRGKVTINENQALNFFPPQEPESPGLSSSTKLAATPPIQAMKPVRLTFLQRLLSLFTRTPRAQIPPPFSLVFTDVNNDRWPAFTAMKTPENPTQDHKDLMENQAIAAKELIDLATYLHRKRAGSPVKLRGVSLNWLTNGVRSEPGGTGGPGGPPSAAATTDVGKHTFTIPPAITGLPVVASPLGSRKDMVVAILDTAYSEAEIENIKLNWATHDLIPQLFGTPATAAAPGTPGKLHVHAGFVPSNYMSDVEVDGHDYNMTDHGLFVSGIIHTLAPTAELHLYQVLNKHGLGDLQGIACALLDVMSKFGNGPLVINMSLTLNLPVEDAHFTDDYGIRSAILDKRPKPFWWWVLLRWVCWVLRWIFGKPFPGCNESWFDSQSVPFEWMSDLAHGIGSGVIAAAGNHGRAGNRPSALYPAAYDSVLGVGALSRGAPWDRARPLSPSSYSNLADTPTTQGIAVFGGENGHKNGLLGVYLGNIPDGSPNPLGWAWWSGTSFATPIISGLVADLIINGKATNTQDAISRLSDIARRSPHTREGEGILTVEQPR